MREHTQCHYQIQETGLEYCHVIERLQKGFGLTVGFIGHLYSS
jgi:hypothetical protein